MTIIGTCQGVSPPRSPAPQLVTTLEIEEEAIGGAAGDRAGSPSSSGRRSAYVPIGEEADQPSPIPGLPLIEIRRPSQYSHYDLAYRLGSPDGGDCAPLLEASGANNQSRKSSVSSQGSSLVHLCVTTDLTMVMSFQAHVAQGIPQYQVIGHQAVFDKAGIHLELQSVNNLWCKQTI